MRVAKHITAILSKPLFSLEDCPQLPPLVQGETWTFVPDNRLYLASDQGRIFSLRTGLILRPATEKRGYQHVALANRLHYWVHRIILTTFKGAAPVNTECRHFDGDAGNNRLSNLGWGTHEENEADKQGHGTISRCSKTGVFPHKV